MRRVTLRGTDIETTALGFGTASLMGRLDRRESMRLLDVAYECGIRHFDTAPSYGYGEAEDVLGAFLRRRPDVTVTTKFGLPRPAAASPLRTTVKNLARPVLRAFPGLRKPARAAAQTESAPATNFEVAAARTSFEESLRRLGRDRVDIVLLHEARAGDLHDDRLLEFLTGARARGALRAFGLGTDFATVRDAADAAPAFVGVLQFANNPGQPNLERAPELARQACITHSPFGGIGRVGHDALATAMRYARTHNPDGIVLFSSQREEHIRDNVRAFE